MLDFEAKNIHSVSVSTPDHARRDGLEIEHLPPVLVNPGAWKPLLDLGRCHWRVNVPPRRQLLELGQVQGSCLEAMPPAQSKAGWA